MNRPQLSNNTKCLGNGSQLVKSAKDLAHHSQLDNKTGFSNRHQLEVSRARTDSDPSRYPRRNASYETNRVFAGIKKSPRCGGVNISHQAKAVLESEKFRSSDVLDAPNETNPYAIPHALPAGGKMSPQNGNSDPAADENLFVGTDGLPCLPSMSPRDDGYFQLTVQGKGCYPTARGRGNPSAVFEEKLHPLRF